MILITGNAGFIGKYLTEVLLDQGYNVCGLDTRPRTDTLSGFRQIEGNVLDKNIVKQSLSGADCIIHLAAEHKDFGIPEKNYFRTNVDGTKILLEAAAEAGIKKFIFYSSVAVYGIQSSTTEETAPDPVNPYGASKIAAEKEISKWAEEDKKRTTIIIRPAVVFGPNNRANIFRLIRQICDGKFIMVGRGKNIKSVAYVENLTDATVYLMNLCPPGISIYNYADEPHMQMKELVELIGKISDRKLRKLYLPLGIAEAGGYSFDILGKITGIDFPITAARMKKFTVPTHHRAERIRQLGFVPKFSIEEGLKKNIDWYLRKKKDLSDDADSSD
ncbi:MAG: NAD(P)-dependent oxidoreductase [Bacteroidetes bacterium]|nr:NAD(P)-dependent oxidoreductase [Bacteroidota bacterium]